ncbi:hypothetical protein DYB28_014014, partial [Aphanomyces astaci]
VITDHVMETQQLVPPYEVTVHHACRLKMYHEGGREVTEDLEAQIAFGDGGFHVERLDEARCVDGQHQVLVKWLELDHEESSWEPAANLLDDIPSYVARGEVFCSVQSNWVALSLTHCKHTHSVCVACQRFRYLSGGTEYFSEW